MKRLLWIVLVAFAVNTAFGGQNGIYTPPVVKSESRPSYMIRTYSLTAKQAQEYENLLRMKKKKEDQLKKKKISAEVYKRESLVLYQQFCKEVSGIFSPMQYKQWSQYTTLKERVRKASEDWGIEADKIVQVTNAEKEYTRRRVQLDKSAKSSEQNYAERDVLSTDVRTTIRTLLGDDLGIAYFSERSIEGHALKYVDRYKVDYATAEMIAQIDQRYGNKKTKLKLAKLPYKSYKEQDEHNKQEMFREMKSALPSEVYRLWMLSYDNSLDTLLAEEYGMTKANISKFKEAYNQYALMEYMVYKSKVSKDNKYSKLKSANQKFCTSVQSLFNTPELYQRWRGKQVHNFQKIHRLVNKLLTGFEKRFNNLMNDL